MRYSMSKLGLSFLGRTLRSIAIAAAFLTGSSVFISSTAYAQASPSTHTSATRYDIKGRVTGTIASDPDGTGALTFLATRNTYDVHGNVIKVETGSLTAWQPTDTKPENWSGFAIHRTIHATYDIMNRKTRTWMIAGGVTQNVTEYSYDTEHRVICTAVRMNPASWGTPTNACAHTAEGPDGKDRIVKNIYDANLQVAQVRRAVGTPLEQGEVTYSYTRSEERRVGKECRSRWSPYH